MLYKIEFEVQLTHGSSLLYLLDHFSNIRLGGVGAKHSELRIIMLFLSRMAAILNVPACYFANRRSLRCGDVAR